MTCLFYAYNKYGEEKKSLKKKKSVNVFFLKKEQLRRVFLVIDKEGEDEMVTGSKLLAMV